MKNHVFTHKFVYILTHTYMHSYCYRYCKVTFDLELPSPRAPLFAKRQYLFSLMSGFNY